MRPFLILSVLCAALFSTSMALAESLPKWQIDKTQSTLGFRFIVMGADVSGVFHDYDADIIFDPNHLSKSYAKIVIRTRSADTQNDERDSRIVNEEWFASTQYPTATFETQTFRHVDGNQYLAEAMLTIRDMSRKVTLPFTLDMAADGKVVRVQGELPLNRLDYNVGTGQWESGDSVGLDITAYINLHAKTED